MYICKNDDDDDEIKGKRYDQVIAVYGHACGSKKN